MAVLDFPKNPASQTPANTYGPTSSPAKTTNGVTYVYANSKWEATVPGGGGGGGTAGDVSYEYPGSGFEQTVQTRLEQYVSVKDFGAVGDGSTDDYVAVKAAFDEVTARGGVLVFPTGVYRLTNSLSNNSVDTTNPIALEGNNSTINFDYASTKDYGLYIQSTGDAPSAVSVKNFTFKGNSKVATCVFVTSAANLFGSVTCSNLQISDLFQASDGSRPAIGVSVSSADIVNVESNSIENVTREKAAGVCAGISVTSSLQVSIRNNYVKNVNFGTGSAADADGVKVFNTNTSGFYSRDLATVTGNTFIDCAGRFIKLQTGGKCVVRDNLCKIETALELITNWKGVDSQSGFSEVINNTFAMSDDWTGGSSANLFNMQFPESDNIEYPYEAVQQIVKNNVVTIKKNMPYCFLVGAPQVTTNACKFVFHAEGNVIHNDKTLQGNSQVNTFSSFVDTVGDSWPDPDDLNSEIIWEIKNNTACVYDWVDTRTSAARDYTDKWYFHFVNNQKIPYDLSRNIVSRGIYTSTLEVADTLGGVYWPFDFKKILPGCRFQSGGGTGSKPINGPSSSTYRGVISNGQSIQVWNTGSLYLSGDGGENWSANLALGAFVKELSSSAETAELTDE